MIFQKENLKVRLKSILNAEVEQSKIKRDSHKKFNRVKQNRSFLSILLPPLFPAVLQEGPHVMLFSLNHCSSTLSSHSVQTPLALSKDAIFIFLWH